MRFQGIRVVGFFGYLGYLGFMGFVRVLGYLEFVGFVGFQTRACMQACVRACIHHVRLFVSIHVLRFGNVDGADLADGMLILALFLWL